MATVFVILKNGTQFNTEKAAAPRHGMISLCGVSIVRVRSAHHEDIHSFSQT